MNPEDITREIMWNVGPISSFAMYTFFVISMIIFAYGFWKRWKVWDRGHRKSPVMLDSSQTASGADEAVQADANVSAAGGSVALSTSLSEEMTAAGSAARLMRHVVAQVRIARIPWAYLSHMSIFYSFIVLFIGTCLVAIQHYGLANFLYGNFYLVFSFIMDLAGVFFVGGLTIAILRRLGLTKVKPSTKAADWTILGLFFVIGVTGFVVEAFRIVATRPDFETVSFVGWWMAGIMERAGMGYDAALTAHITSWWVHMVLVFVFIGMIPYTKLLHFLIAPLHIALTPEKHSGRFAPVSLEEVEETGKFGLDTVTDFSRGQLLSYDACTQCRRCEAACPAWNTNKPLSPMEVVLDIARNGHTEGSLHGDVISAETLWSCTTCGACVHNCPVLIDQMGTIVEMRRFLVGEGQVVGSTQSAIRSIAAQGNPWGLPQEERASWAAGLDVPTIDENPEPDVLYWVGCSGSYDRRNQNVSRSVAKILKAAGVNFAILGKQECCSGDPARRLGDEFTYMEMATTNVGTLSQYKFKKVLTACAHCFNTLSNEYPDFGGNYDVVHHSEFIQELIDSGRLELKEVPGEGPVAYHDPCYVSRHNKMPQPARNVLKAAGGSSLPIVEPEQHGERTFCCGAGGGRMFMEEDIDKRVNIKRFDQLKETGAKTVAVGCPFCMTMMDDAAKNDEESGIVVKDLAELVAERLPDADNVPAETAATN